MKFVRFGAAGEEKPGLIDRDGGLRDLSGHVGDLSGAALDPDNLAKLAAVDPTSPAQGRRGYAAWQSSWGCAHIHCDRLELCRSCGRNRCSHSTGTGALQQGEHVHLRT